MHGLSAGAEWIRTFSSALDRQRFRGFFLVGARRTGPPCSCRPRHTDRLAGRLSEEPTLTARIRRHHTAAALSAVRVQRGTEGSNLLPASGESVANSVFVPRASFQAFGSAAGPLSQCRLHYGGEKGALRSRLRNRIYSIKTPRKKYRHLGDNRRRLLCHRSRVAEWGSSAPTL
jgi:hypothetical protein